MALVLLSSGAADQNRHFNEAHTETSDERTRAGTIFKTARAADIRFASEASFPR